MDGRLKFPGYWSNSAFF